MAAGSGPCRAMSTATAPPISRSRCTSPTAESTASRRTTSSSSRRRREEGGAGRAGRLLAYRIVPDRGGSARLSAAGGQKKGTAREERLPGWTVGGLSPGRSGIVDLVVGGGTGRILGRAGGEARHPG